MRRWLSIFIVLASLLPLPGVTGRAHAQAGRFTPQQEAWMRQTFLKWVQDNESAVSTMYGRTNYWNSAYSWTHTYSGPILSMFGQTNNWNTAYGWGDWSPRVGLLEGQTNNWNTAYGYGPHAGLYDLVGSALAVSNDLIGRTITINGEAGSLSSNLSFTIAGGGGGDVYSASNNMLTGTNTFTALVTVSNVGDTALSVFGDLLVTDTIMGSGLALDGTVDVPNPEVLVTPYAGGAYSSVRWNFGDIRPGSENFGWSWVTDPDANNTHAYTLFDQSTLYPGLGNPILRFDSNQTFNIYWDTYHTNLYVYGTLYGTATNALLLAGRSEADISNSVMAAAQALTNGLASTNWVVAQGYVTEAITNGLWRLEDGTNWVANVWWPLIDASAIAATDIANWDTAWGWGDHAGLYDLLGSAAAASNGVIAQLVSSNWISHASGTALYGSSNGQWVAVVIPPGDVTAAGDNVFSGSNTFDGTVSMNSNLLFKGSNVVGVVSVDGILGSEADTVDGYHAASFAILSSNNTFAGGTTQAFDSATVTNLTMRGTLSGGGTGGGTISSSGILTWDGFPSWPNTFRHVFSSVYGIYSCTNSAGGTSINLYRSGGTYQTPTACSNGWTGAINFREWDGDSWVISALIQMSSDETASLTSTASKFSFFTTPPGSQTPLERLRVAPEGAVRLYNMTTATTTGSGYGVIAATNNEVYVWDGSGNRTLLSSENEAGEMIRKTDKPAGGFSETVNLTQLGRMMEDIAAGKDVKQYAGKIYTSNAIPVIDWRANESRQVSERAAEIAAWEQVDTSHKAELVKWAAIPMADKAKLTVPTKEDDRPKPEPYAVREIPVWAADAQKVFDAKWKAEK